jgi:hypothetical protein
VVCVAQSERICVTVRTCGTVFDKLSEQLVDGEQFGAHRLDSQTVQLKFFLRHLAATLDAPLWPDSAT